MTRMEAGGSAGKIVEEICNAFGLKHVNLLDIHFAIDEIATVTARFYPEIDGVKQLVPILKKFELKEKKEDKEVA